MWHRDSALARLILVDVQWAEWNSSTDREKYVKVIKELLKSPPGKADGLGPAHIHMCYDKDRKPWTVDKAPYELPPRDDCLQPKLWLEDEDGLRQVGSALPTGSDSKPAPGNKQVHGVAGWGQFFRARVFMDAKRYRAAVGCEGDADYWALIDMRFQQVSEDRVLWHSSLSVWSGIPWNPHHHPGSLQSEDSRGMSSTDANRLAWDFRKHFPKGFP